MSVIAELIRAGVDPDLVDRVIEWRLSGIREAMQDIAPRKSAGALRQERWRQRLKASQSVSETLRETPSQNVSEASQGVSEASLAHTRARDKESSSLDSKKVRKKERNNEFRKFYDPYPRHVAVEAASKAFDSAIARGVPPDKIVSASIKFGERHRLALTEEKFIPHPATWLNSGRYEDEELSGPGPPNGHASDHVGTPEDTLWNWAVASGQTDAPRAQEALRIIESRKAKNA